MGKAYSRMVERRQLRLAAQDRRNRWIWIGLAVLAVVVTTMVLMREDPATGPVDVNTASLELLQTLPGVGPEMADRILAERPFSQPEDLLRVKGIGPKTLEAMRSRLRFGRGLGSSAEGEFLLPEGPRSPTVR